MTKSLNKKEDPLPDKPAEEIIDNITKLPGTHSELSSGDLVSNRYKVLSN